MAQSPKRRWVRYSLRTLLVFITVLAVGLGWVAHERSLSRHELQIAEQLRASGADARLGGIFDDLSQSEQSWWRTVTGNILGPRLQYIQRRNFMRTEASDISPLAGLTNLRILWLEGPILGDLSPLAGLKNLNSLYLDGTEGSDLSPLSGLTNLQVLWLKGMKLGDLTPLAELKNLNSLVLDGTGVSKEQVQTLQTTLPNCKISAR